MASVSRDTTSIEETAQWNVPQIDDLEENISLSFSLGSSSFWPFSNRSRNQDCCRIILITFRYRVITEAKAVV